LVAEMKDIIGAPTAELRVEESVRIFTSPLTGENSSVRQ